MNSSELLTLYRSEMEDISEPYLWADEDIFSYANDAQKMFARDTGGIPDGTTAAVTRIEVTPTDDWYALHPSILQIRTASRVDTGRPVEVLNFEDMRERRWYFDNTVGMLRAMVIGIERHKVRMWPYPNETVNVDMTVFRLPLVEITDVGDQEFEVDVEHHRHLLHWMRHLGYLKQDTETFDKSKANEFEAKHIAYCAKVKEEEARKRHKTRFVRYGGI